MHFAYEGFTHSGDIRSFIFRSIEGYNSANVFSIEIDLTLLARYRVPVQDAPQLCLYLLNTASLAGSTGLSRFHSYRVVGEDLQPLLIERERKAAEKALKKYPRPTPRRPSVASSLRLGTPESGI